MLRSYHRDADVGHGQLGDSRGATTGAQAPLLDMKPEPTNTTPPPRRRLRRTTTSVVRELRRDVAIDHFALLHAARY